jgi:hypothetical protein
VPGKLFPISPRTDGCTFGADEKKLAFPFFFRFILKNNDYCFIIIYEENKNAPKRFKKRSFKMTVIEATAKSLQMKTDDLLRESLKIYIDQKLSAIEAEIFSIAKKHGVKDVFDLDKRIEEGLVSENEAYEDYFRLDYLEAERQKLKDAAENF